LASAAGRLYRRVQAHQQGKRSMSYEGMIAETVAFTADKGDRGEAYLARPLGAGPFPGVVLIHHAPGWDPWIKEATRKLAFNGFATIAPHLYFRDGPGTPDDVAARARAAGGVPDAQVIGDVAGCADLLRKQFYANGKIGVIGFCSRDAQRQEAGGADRSHQEPQMPAARHLRQRGQEPLARPGEPHRRGAEEARQEIRVPPL
jgi:hypothetical protein